MESVSDPEQKNHGSFNAATIAEMLESRKIDVLQNLLPAGKIQGHEYVVGSLSGEEGESLKIHLNGKGAVWADFATGDKGGDLLDLWAAVRCSGDLKAAMREAAQWLGMPGNGKKTYAKQDNRAEQRRQQEGLGEETGRWTYHDAEGKPWIDVVRFDLPGGKKRFHQYDHRANCWTGTPGYELPKPRPLFDLHLLSGAEYVIFVEGEKCAQKLRELGFTATTTIQGANSPHLTDFAPLRGKTVYVWPDNDAAGKAYADKGEKILVNVGATSLRVNIPEGKPDGWDAADAIDHDHWTAEQVQAFLDTARPTEARIFRPYNIAEFLSLDIKPREHLIAPWLPVKGLAMVHAWRGVGKTYFTLGAAYAIAAGDDFLAWKVPKPHKVLYIDGEMPAGVLQSRLAEIVGGATKEPPSADYFRLLSADLFPEGIADLSTEAGQKTVEPFLDGVDLVVLDNLSTLVRSGEENAAEAWLPIQQWVLALRRRDVAVLLVHHSGKTGLQRGSSRREDVLDTVIHLKHPSDYQFSDGCRFEVHFEKARGFHGAAAEPIDAQYITAEGAGSPSTWTFRKTEAALTDRIVELHAQGFAYSAIAKELGVSKTTVSRHIDEAKRTGKIK